MEISGITLFGGQTVNGIYVDCYAASVFTSAPSFNAIPPSSGFGASVISGPPYGAPGAYILEPPLSQDYYVRQLYRGDNYWSLGPQNSSGAGSVSSGPWESGTGLDSAQLVGAGSNASGDYSVAEGSGTTASGPSAHAEGYGTTASGQTAHAEGNGSQATGDYSHAEGLSSQATAAFTHAEGFETTASNITAHAEGQSTTASGQNSHAEGRSSQSLGEASHAEGELSFAYGEASHASGYTSWAYSSAQYAHSAGTPAGLGIGASQYSRIVGSQDTTNATAASVSNGFNLPLVQFQNESGTAVWNKTIGFTACVVGRRFDTPGTASFWQITGLIDGNGSSAYRFVGGTPVPLLIVQDVAAATWTVAISISSNTLVVTVTGASAQTINWTVVMDLTESAA